MAIAYVTGAKGDSTTAVATLSVSLTGTAGDVIVVFLTTAAAVTSVSCEDTHSPTPNTLTPGPTIVNGQAIYSFYYIVPTGQTPTGFICSWTGNEACSMTVVEFSGVTNVQY